MNGEVTTALPLVQRKQLLETLLDQLPGVTYCQHFPGNGLDFFKLMKEEKMEGLMAKKADSTYTPGIRSSDWLKIKFSEVVDALIGGFRVATDSRNYCINERKEDRRQQPARGGLNDLAYSIDIQPLRGFGR